MDLSVLAREPRLALGFMLLVTPVFGTGEGEELQGGEFEGLGDEERVLLGDRREDVLAISRFEERKVVSHLGDEDLHQLGFSFDYASSLAEPIV